MFDSCDTGNRPSYTGRTVPIYVTLS